MKSDTLVSGLKWSFLERGLVILLQLFLEVILARLLVPEDYGLLGMILVVVAFANVFIDSGFSNALIHFQDRTEADFSSVFYLSIAIGITCYLVLYSVAPLISTYYSQDLTLMIRIIGINILFNSFGVIYKTKLIIQIDFKKQTLYSALSLVISGIIGITLATRGDGVWSLIIQLLVYSFLFNFFLFFNYKFIPRLLFDQNSLRRIFKFGGNIFLSSVLQAVYFNAYPLVLGRVYPSKIVGLYTKVNQLSIYPAGVISGVIQRVLLPFLSTLQNNKKQIYQHNLKFVKLYTLVAFPLIGIAIFFARPIVMFLLSDAWIEIVRPLQILLLTSAFFPIIILNMNIFQVLGKTRIFLRTEIFVKIIGIIILFLTFKYGFIVVCLGILFQIITQFVITAIFSSFLLEQNRWMQLHFVFKVLIWTVILYFILLLLGLSPDSNSVLKSVVGIVIYALGYFVIVRYFYRKEIEDFINFVKKRIL